MIRQFLPICIDVAHARIVMIGGGKVALQKLTTICGFAGNVWVFGKEILPDIKQMNVRWEETEFDASQLAGSLLVYACTDDRLLNRRIGEEGRRLGALVNVADDPDECDFISPAVYREGDMTVAVSSNGKRARQSVVWRNAIREFVKNDLSGR